MTILHLEDDASLRLYFYSLLTERGFTVISLPDPRGVIHILDDYDVDIVITDMMMPHHTGLEAIQMIREHKEYQSVPIIVMSSISNPDFIREAKERGANEYLIKSQVTGDEVVRILRSFS